MVHGRLERSRSGDWKLQVLYTEASKAPSQETKPPKMCFLIHRDSTAGIYLIKYFISNDDFHKLFYPNMPYDHSRILFNL